MAKEKRFKDGSLSDFEDDMIQKFEEQQAEIDTLKQNIEGVKK